LYDWEDNLFENDLHWKGYAKNKSWMHVLIIAVPAFIVFAVIITVFAKSMA
jgi:hypothetical protein